MKLSDGEKLIAVMLTELFDHLKVDSDLDPEFIRRALHSGNAWAIAQQYGGIFQSEEANPPDVHEVYRILGMWDVLEREYEDLSPTERGRVKTAAGLRGDVKFDGFDGNNETAQLGIAQFIVENMDQFSRFKGRDLNSHLPTSLEIYRRMLPVHERQLNSSARELTADDIIEIMNARRP